MPLPSAQERLREVEELDRLLAAHPLYRSVQDAGDLRLFLEHHAVCVLDFMSLLKSLQRDLTCVEVPWRPAGHPEAARLIHDIVRDEESDALPDGRHLSHFEWYLEAMDECGADSSAVRRLAEGFAAGLDPASAIARAGLPAPAGAFARTTFRLLEHPLHVRAAVFLHGREDLIPRMFLPLARHLERSGTPCSLLVAYLRRHVEADGEEHGPAARRLLEQLYAGDEDRRAEALAAAVEALHARRRLWNALHVALAGRRAALSAS